MLDTQAGIQLLRYLTVCRRGDVIGRERLRTYINDKIPNRHFTQGDAKHADRRSKTTNELNRALRYLERQGVLERGAANCIVILELGPVPGLLVQAEAKCANR